MLCGNIGGFTFCSGSSSDRDVSSTLQMKITQDEKNLIPRKHITCVITTGIVRPFAVGAHAKTNKITVVVYHLSLRS